MTSNDLRRLCKTSLHDNIMMQPPQQISLLSAFIMASSNEQQTMTIPETPSRHPVAPSGPQPIRRIHERCRLDDCDGKVGVIPDPPESLAVSWQTQPNLDSSDDDVVFSALSKEYDYDRDTWMMYNRIVRSRCNSEDSTLDASIADAKDITIVEATTSEDEIVEHTVGEDTILPTQELDYEIFDIDL